MGMRRVKGSLVASASAAALALFSTFCTMVFFSAQGGASWSTSLWFLHDGAPLAAMALFVLVAWNGYGHGERTPLLAVVIGLVFLGLHFLLHPVPRGPLLDTAWVLGAWTGVGFLAAGAAMDGYRVVLDRRLAHGQATALPVEQD